MALPKSEQDKNNLLEITAMEGFDEAKDEEIEVYGLHFARSPVLRLTVKVEGREAGITLALKDLCREAIRRLEAADVRTFLAGGVVVRNLTPSPSRPKPKPRRVR